MAKAVISNRIYLDNPGKEKTQEITKALTYKLTRYSAGKSGMANVEVIRNYKILTGGILSIPQGRFDLIPEDYEVLDRRTVNDVPFPSPLYPLRVEQEPVYNEVNDNAFINALPGWGKTFTALYLAAKLGQKTLIITHTTALRDQWYGEIKSLFGMKPGVIGSGQYDIEDHAIVVSNVQSLIKHVDKLSKEFGTVIVDECHHVAATTFTNILDALHCRYRVGLSGTMQRKDGKHCMFKDYFGSHVVTPPASNTMPPSVLVIKSGITLKANAAWTDKITQLTSDAEYQQFISNVAKTQVNKGHSVLIIADRVEFLEKVKENVGETCLLVTGSTSFEDREKAKEQLLSREKMCVAGSRQIFSEGISINALSCVILAIPMSNDSLLEQIAGRIMRLYEGKLDPLIIDINFAGYADKKQNNDRLGLYMRKGWKVRTI